MGSGLEVASAKEHQKLPLCWKVLSVPEGSKMNLSLAKAEPICNGGSAPVMTY